MVNPSNQEVTAVVSPRSVGGVSLFATVAPITKENVAQFHSSAADVHATANELRKLGFSILSMGETTISIGGTRKLFQEVFGAKLRKQKREIEGAQALEFFSVESGQESQLLQAPADLANLIEGVALAEPPEYFEAALPPLTTPDPAAYRYLLVPDEVALLLRATRIHRAGTTGRGVVVAMIDTGHYRHPFFNEHGYRLLPTLLGPGASDPSSDLYGHGTGESANIFATAPDIELRPIKDAGDPVGAFNIAVASSPKPQVISNSWGYNIDFPGATLNPYLRALEAAIANAVANNIVVCFSAGNGHQAFPASHPDVIAVGGVHVNYPGLDFEASSYASSFVSNLYPGRAVPDLCGLTGKRVTIGGAGLAPSLMLPVQSGSTLDNIAPPTSGSADGWGLFSGTSAACPQVAGVVALLLEKDPTLTPAKVKEILVKSARDITAGTTATGGATGPGPDAATGAGLVDAKWAWIITMGDVAAYSFEALLAAQPQPAAVLNGNGNGKHVHFSRDMMSDLMATLRSR